MCKSFKEQYGFVSDAKDKIEVQIPINGKPTPHDITDEMRTACSILIPPIAYAALVVFALLIVRSRSERAQKFAGLRILR